MNERRDLLKLRRDVLAARSSLLRLRATAELQAVRDSFTLQEMAGAIATSPRARSIAFTVLVMLAGPRRIARMVRIAAIAVGIAKTVTLVGKVLRQSEPTSAASSQSPEATS